MFDQILSKIQTQDDQEKILEEIEVLLASLYQDRDLGFESTLKHRIRAWFAALLRQEFSDEAIDREKFLVDLKQKISDLDKVYLTLAFEASQDAQDRFAGLIRQSLANGVILNLSYDPALIGGVQIVYKGQFRDFSLKRIFEREFEKSSEDLVGLV